MFQFVFLFSMYSHLVSSHLRSHHHTPVHLVSTFHVILSQLINLLSSYHIISYHLNSFYLISSFGIPISPPDSPSVVFHPYWRPLSSIAQLYVQLFFHRLIIFVPSNVPVENLYYIHLHTNNPPYKYYSQYTGLSFKNTQPKKGSVVHLHIPL